MSIIGPGVNFLLFEYESNKGLLSKITTSKNISMEFVYYTEADYVTGETKPDLLWVKEIRMPDGSKLSYEYADKRLSKVTKIGTDGSSEISWEMQYTDGVMTQVSDACGNPYEITYENKKVEQVTYPNGEAIRLKYSENGCTTETYKVVTENGAETEILLETNEFESASGNSLKMTDSKGNSVSYEYMDNLLAKTKYSMVYQELSDGKVVEKTTEKAETKNYNSSEELTEEIDEDGIRTTYKYPEQTGAASDHLPIEKQEKDAEGNFISYEKYTYDSLGNVTKIYEAVEDVTTVIEYYEADDPANGKIKGEIKSMVEYMGSGNYNNVSTKYEYSYDDSGRKTEIKTETSQEYKVTTTTVYDVMGRQIKETTVNEALAGSSTKYTTVTETSYDALGRISTVKATQGDITDVVTREYDANGTLVKETQEDGTVYTYAYDSMNRVVKESIQKGGLNKTWTTEYGYGEVTIQNGKGTETVKHAQITTEKNPEGEILETTYADSLGKVVREKSQGLYVDYSYDKEGKVITKSVLGTNPNNEEPLVTLYLYDEGGNVTNQILNPSYDAETGCFTVAENSITQSMIYDSKGNVISTTDGEGQTITYTYDTCGRVTKTTLPANSSGSSNVTTVQYDVRNADGTTSDIITDALGRTSVTTYNSTMQPIEVADKGDGSITAIKTNYTYNSKGLLSKSTGSTGTAITYEYDGKDRVTTVHYLNASGEEELRTCYTYDKSDNVTVMRDYKVSDGSATLYRYTGYTYDRLKNLTGFTEIDTTTEPTDAQIAANTAKYAYDIDGNLLSITYPESLEWNVKGLKYSYDSNQWIQKVIAVLEDGTEAELRSYSYNNFGDVSTITGYRVLTENGTKVKNPEYTTCTYTYDIYGRPVSMTYTDSTAPDVVKESYSCAYDRNSRITQETITNLYPEAEEDRQSEVRSYTYDNVGQLKKMSVEDLLNNANSYQVSYSYDAVGNRTAYKKTGSTQTEDIVYSYNSLNQLLSNITTDATETVTEKKTYSYYADGSLKNTTDSISKTSEENTYDAAGRLKSYVKTQNGTQLLTQTNEYNGAGARITKTEAGDTINYYYGLGGLLYTEDGAGNGTALNLSGISGNVIATARLEEGTEDYFYYHKDIAGSTTNLRSASGESIVSYQYSEFGETSIYGDTDFYNEICYNSGIYDKNTGLYYLNARYYDPEDGRFISRDSYRGSASNPSTLHLYAYCANNPVNLSDPSGHIAISRIVGGIVGAVVGAAAGAKIAKSKNLTGWKKVAVIAGCTLGGAAIGALAGPKVVKVAKKAAKYVVKKLPSKTKVVKATKQAVKKTKTTAKKVTSKTKQVVSKTKKLASSEKNLGKGAYNGNIGNGRGLGKLEGKKINVSQKGIDIVEKHLSGEFSDVTNDAMISRLKNALVKREK